MTKRLTIDLRWIDSSGVGTYIQGMLPGLIASLSDVAIIGIGDAARLREFAWAGSANVQLLDCRAARYSLREQAELPFIVPRGTDLFFSPYYTIPLAYRGPLAVTVHDMSHLVVREIAGNWKKRLYAQAMFRAVRKRASVVLTVSHFSKAEFCRLTRGDDESRIVPIPLGIAEDWYEAARLAPVRSRPYLIYVGNIKPYKNLPRLVEAFLQVKERIPHDLVIVGQGEGLITGESQQFFDRVRGAGDRIHLAGFVSRAELLSLVGHASALVLPSLYEGFGLPPLEAMAAGVPAIVARAASLPEVCGEAAHYFDPLQAEDIALQLVAVLGDAARQRELIQKGLVQSRAYTWKKCAEATAIALGGALLR